MNYVSIVSGLIAIGFGLIAFVQQLSAANRAKVRLMKHEGNTAALTTHITGAVATTVMPICIGAAFLILGLMGRSLFPFSLLGW